MGISSQLQNTVAHFRQQLLSKEAQAEHVLTQAHKHTLSMIHPQLDSLYRQVNILQQAGETIPPSWLYEQRKLQTLMQGITIQLNQFAITATIQTRLQQQQGVSIGMHAAGALLKVSLPPMIPWPIGAPSPQAIQNIVGVTQAGSPLADLFDGFGEEAAAKASQALITGVSLGAGPARIAFDLQQALGISRNRALVISRQELLRSYKSAALETYQANSDIVSKWRWQASRNSQVCVLCIAMDGTIHELSESLDSHICCRCAPVPVTKSWSELGVPGLLDAPEEDGQTGVEWLEEQDEQTQRAIFSSNAAYDLYTSGAATLHDFVGVKHDASWGISRYVKSAQEVAT